MSVQWLARAVTVVQVKIHDEYTVEAAVSNEVLGGDGNVVEKDHVLIPIPFSISRNTA